MSPVYAFSLYWIRVVYDLFFRGEVAGLENIPQAGPFIIASNHASHLDPPFVGCHVNHQICFFARKTLWKPGPAAWWLDAVGTIPVDREGSDVGALRKVIGALGEGQVILLFPEGTRSPDGSLQPAKPGVGMIACKTGVPVLPARIFGSWQAFGKGGPLRPFTPISVTYGRPLPPSEYDFPEQGKQRYQIASERIMAAIAALENPQRPVI